MQTNIRHIEVGEDFDSDPAKWFVSHALPEMRFLLAHADDGVIWGEVREDALVLAGDTFPQVAVPLRAVTLQQARLFGSAGELRVWRGGSGTFVAAQIEPVDGDDVITEEHWLWGTRQVEERDGFSLLREGNQGMLHAPPIVGLRDKQRVALIVHHSIAVNQTNGEARIGTSRLAGLVIKEDLHG